MSARTDAGKVLNAMQLYSDIKEQKAYQKGVDDTITSCAKIVSKMVGICKHSCPIGCEWGTDESCVESWKIYLKEHIGETSSSIYDRGYQQGRADAFGTIGVTEDGEYIMYNGHLYKKVADRVKGAEE